MVERWILAALRNRTFFSLAELNAAIAKLLERLNNRPFRKLPGSRRSLFEQLDRPALRPLPAERYVFAQWKKARVNIDYHVEVDRHYYSVPHALVGRQLDVRLTATTVGVPVPQSACRQPRALPPARPSYHRRRAYAREAPKDGPVVPRTLHPLGHNHRTANRDPHRNGASVQTPPPAGVPLVPGHPAPGRQLRRGAPGGRRGARGRARRQQLPQRRIHPQPPPRPAPQRADRARPRHRCIPTFVARAITPDPETRHVDSSHRGQARRDQLRCVAMAKAPCRAARFSSEIEALSFEERLGLIVDRELTERASASSRNRLRRARLRHAACIEDIDFRQPRGVNRPRPRPVAGRRALGP